MSGFEVTNVWLLRLREDSNLKENLSRLKKLILIANYAKTKYIRKELYMALTSLPLEHPDQHTRGSSKQKRTKHS